ncbi:MAG: hypothetical protein QOJ89_501 [bacterium]
MSAPAWNPRDDSANIGERIRSVATTVGAPDALRRRIGAQRDAVVERGARGGRAGTLAVAAAGVALLLAAILVGLPGGADEPSIADAASVALRAPANPAPARPPTVDGVRFPVDTYGARGWHAVGIRRERTGGRELVAVSYAGSGTRLGYAIVAAPALELPPGTRLVVRDGIRFWAFSAHGATVLTWRRAGRTCVVASRTASEERLLAFAVGEA